MVQERHIMDDGVSLFLRLWEADSSKKINKPKAVLHIIHGMGEHSGRYDRLARRLVENGMEVWAADQRGHGETAANAQNPPGQGGLHGHCADGDGFSRVCEDIHILNKIIKSKYPDTPLFLLGHSWGSFIAQYYIENFEGLSKREDGLNLAGCILSGTRGPGGVKIAMGAPVMAFLAFINGERNGSKMAREMAGGSYNNAFRPNRTEFDWLSRDEKEVDAYVSDPFCGFLCSSGFYRDMSKALKRIHRKDEMKKIRQDLPVYIFSGTMDPVTDMGKSHAALEAAYRHLGIRDLETALYPGARHETLNETNRDEVTGNLISWLHRHFET